MVSQLESPNSCTYFTRRLSSRGVNLDLGWGRRAAAAGAGAGAAGGVGKDIGQWMIGDDRTF